MDVALDAATRAALVKAKRLGTTDGRLAVLAARRVEAATDASDAAFVALMREYRVSMDAAMVGLAPVSASGAASDTDVEGGDDEPQRPVGSTASSLTLVV